MRFRMLMMGLMVAVLLAGQTWADQHQGQPVVTDAAALPLSKIVLYTSGVGYFERQGEVEGDLRLTLRFKTEDIKDLLKSLVVQDADGGQVTMPLTQTFWSPKFGMLTDRFGVAWMVSVTHKP